MGGGREEEVEHRAYLGGEIILYDTVWGYVCSAFVKIQRLSNTRESLVVNSEL